MHKIVSGVFANQLQKINMQHDYNIDFHLQKGFIKEIEGCLKHALKISMLILYAKVDKKISLFSSA
jgi:hypothetical protein